MSGLTDKEWQLAMDYLKSKHWAKKIHIMPGPDLMGDYLIAKEVGEKVTPIAHVNEMQLKAYAKAQEMALRNTGMVQREVSLNDLVDVPLPEDKQKLDPKEKAPDIQQSRTVINKENVDIGRERSKNNSAAPPRPRFGG